MTKLEAAQERLCQHFCGLSVIKCTAQPGRFGQTLCASTRLFTLKSDAPTEQDTTFQPGVDPVGELERIKSADVFHGRDNVVHYFKRAYDCRTRWVTNQPGDGHRNITLDVPYTIKRFPVHSGWET
jgi:hypothetical protein